MESSKRRLNSERSGDVIHVHVHSNPLKRQRTRRREVGQYAMSSYAALISANFEFALLKVKIIE